MSRPTAIHRLIVTAFAAWMLFCCCEKRLFAALLFPDAAASFSCCPSDGAEPVAPEPVAPEPVAPEPVAPELVAPELVAPEPVAPEPAEAEAAPPPCCRACRTVDATCSADVPDADPNSVPDDETSDGAPCRDDPPHGRCCDGCCRKAPAPTTTCTLDRDEIGRDLPPFIAEALVADETRAEAHGFDRSDGRPPPLWRTPRLQLVITARLRI